MPHRDHARAAGAPVLVLTLLFLLCCAILVPVLSASLSLSRTARWENEAATLCRSVLAEYIAAPDPDAAQDALGEDGCLYFDASLAPTDASRAVYTVTSAVQDDPRPAGTLRDVQLSVTREDQTVYTCSTARYFPEVTS